MTDLSAIPDDQLLGLLKQPQASPLASMNDADLLKALGQTETAGSKLTKAVTDIPREAYQTTADQLGTIKAGLPDFAAQRGSSFFDPAALKAQLSGIIDTGKAAAAIPTLPAAPIIGGLRSLGGHTLSAIAPDTTYEQGKEAVDKALMAAAPARYGRVAAPAVTTDLGLPGAAPIEVAPAQSTFGIQPKPSVPAAPLTAEDHITAARAIYKSPELAEVRIDPRSVNSLADSIASEIGEKFGKTRIPSEITDLKNVIPGPKLQGLEGFKAAEPTPLTLTDIDSVRSGLRATAEELNPRGKPTPEATAAKMAIGKIDDFLANIKQPDLLAGDASIIQPMLKEARANWATAAQLQALDRAAFRAANNAGAANSGLNAENALRQQLKSIINSPTQASQFSKPMQREIQKVVRGEGVRNVVRYVGNFLGGGGGLGALTGGLAGHMLLPGLGEAAPALGLGLKLAGNALTNRAYDQLISKVVAQSPLAKRQAQGLFGAIPSRQSGLLPFSAQNPPSSTAKRLRGAAAESDRIDEESRRKNRAH